MTEHQESGNWYLEVGNCAPIEQGDFVLSCPVLIPTGEQIDGELTAIEDQYDVIVLSQSCDLVAQKPKIELVLVSPVWALSRFSGTKGGFYASKEGKEAIRRGNAPGYHMLSKCGIPCFDDEFLVVDFHNVYGVSFLSLITMLKKQDKRLRLRPPYREHLSQAFARFFMRVGLPADIPPFR
ncbi:MAG: hypothetical protein JW941_06230 [Candidatus Coatesbacteria bacterium]|nr:hypothetical protein [Candidatus Coatesbacteria bacterium]